MIRNNIFDKKGNFWWCLMNKYTYFDNKVFGAYSGMIRFLKSYLCLFSRFPTIIQAFLCSGWIARSKDQKNLTPELFWNLFAWFIVQHLDGMITFWTSSYAKAFTSCFSNQTSYGAKTSNVNWLGWMTNRVRQALTLIYLPTAFNISQRYYQ